MIRNRRRLWAILAADAVLAVVVLAVFSREGVGMLLLGVLCLVAVAVVAVVRPKLALLGLLAFPPGVLALVMTSAGLGPRLMQTVIVAAVGVGVLGRKRMRWSGLALGYLAMLVMMAVSYASGRVPNTVGSVNLLTTFTYYAAIHVLVHILASEEPDARIRFADAVQTASLLAVLITGVIALFQLGTAFLTTFSLRNFTENAGFLYTRTHFGYLMALGLAVALPRWAYGVGRRSVWATASIVSAGFVVMSLTRGGWISMALFGVVVALVTRRRWLLALIPAAGFLTLVPGIGARLGSDFSGGALLSIQSGAAGSYRILLWYVLWQVAMRAPWFGHGFGFMSSLSPELYFGEGQFVTADNPLVYAHNDFLYLLLEIGWLGVVAYAAGLATWWGKAATALRASLGGTDPHTKAIVLSCVGVGIVMLVAQVVDNGFFIRAVFERFAAITATLWLVKAVPQPERLESATEAVV